MASAMAKHLLVKHKEQAEELKQRLSKGESFEVLAKKHSICNSAKRGGDLGEIRVGQLVRSVEQVIFQKPVDKVHGPVKSKFGFHLIVVYYRD